MQDQAAFYVTGGTIPPDSPSYVERAADKELLAALGRGELCYVLNARQMGKSSLSVRTRQALEAAGARTAFLDLQKFGSSASAEQWYRALLERIGSDLKLRAAFLTYWKDNAELPPLSRLFGALREVALEQIAGDVVVFLDEIDVVRDLSFKADEFFGAIRESHNARADDPQLTRLTFCIIGTVAPTDLIRDIRLSPFNIGTRVRLADLTPREAAPLAAPLPGGSKTLDRVLWWTSGHPYLTQRLCADLTSSASTDVDAMVSRLFFAKSDADVDENIKNVRNGLLRMGGEGTGFDRTDLLTRYGAIASGKRVPDDDTDGVCTALRLSGLVTSSEGTLRVRNRVYAKLFDAAWVRDNLPDAEVRRQRAAVACARWQIGGIAAAVLIGMGGLLWRTSQAEDRANAEAAIAQVAARNEHSAKVESDNNRVRAERATATARAATSRAESALTGESAAKSVAVASATRATQEARRADQEAQSATLASRTASTQAAIAKANEASATHLAYIGTIGAISRKMDSRDFSAAKKLFEDAERFPQAERGFEWKYLKERFHPELYTIDRGTSGVHHLAFAPDGSRFVSASDDGVACIWSATTRKIVTNLVGRTKDISSVAFSPDGRRIVTANFKGGALVWNAATGKEILTLGDVGQGWSSAFSSDGHRVVTGGSNGAQIWDSVSGKLLANLESNRSLIMSVAFSPDGSRIVGGGGDKIVHVWDSATGKQLLSIAGHTEAVLSVAFSPDGKRIASASYDHSARVWDAGTGSALFTLSGHSNKLLSVSFSADGKRIVTAGADRSARIWDASSGKELVALNGHFATVYTACFSPDGQRVVTAAADDTIRIWDANATREKEVVTMNPGVITSTSDAYMIVNSNVNAPVQGLSFSPDGRRVVVAGGDGLGRVVDVATGRKLLVLRAGNADWMECACYSPDGKRIATAGFDNLVRVWDAGTGKNILVLKGHKQGIESVAFSHDGSRIITGSLDKTARIWDALTGKPQRVLTPFSDAVSSVSFSPDGRRIAAGTASTVRICDSRTGADLRVLDGKGDAFAPLAFSPDGLSIATASTGASVCVRDASNGLQRTTLNGHSYGVSSVAFSSNGSRIVTSGGDDRTARVWDTKTGRELITLAGDTNELHCAVFSPDGEQIATGCIDGTATIWRRVTERQASLLSENVAIAADLDRLPNVPLAQIAREGERLGNAWPGSQSSISNVLNAAAWSVVSPAKPQPTPADARSAWEAARVAVMFSPRPNEFVYDTLAAAYFACGDLRNGLATARQAVEPAQAVSAVPAPGSVAYYTERILNSAAWKIVNPEKPAATPAAIKQALEVAAYAVELSQHKDGAVLNTLAAAQFASGDIEKALETERLAATVPSQNKEMVASITATLKHYEALAASKKALNK